MGIFFDFTHSLNLLGNELIWFLFLLFCFSSILIFLKLFGYVGLYVYTVVAVITGNIQVLKIVDFFYFIEPVALGTILFASTYLCTDILSEYYTKEKAKKNILLGFSSFLLITVIMLFTISFEPSKNDWIQQSLVEVFTPMTRFFIASMFAYLISQYFDVWIYALLKKISKNRNVWLRNNISTLLSSLIDNIIFSILAWIVLNPEPETLYNVIMIYIFGTYMLRVIIAVLDTPILYLAKYFIHK